MNSSSKQSSIHNSEQDANTSLQIIEEFFHHYTLPECRGLLREVLHQALSGYNTRDGIHPADLLRFLEELEKAVVAVWELKEKREE